MNAAVMFTNRISQTLHEEHCATVALMERLEQLLARHRRLPHSSSLVSSIGAETERSSAMRGASLKPEVSKKRNSE